MTDVGSDCSSNEVDVITFNPEFRESGDYSRKGNAVCRGDFFPDSVNLFNNGWIHDVLISLIVKTMSRV